MCRNTRQGVRGFRFYRCILYTPAEFAFRIPPTFLLSAFLRIVAACLFHTIIASILPITASEKPSASATLAAYVVRKTIADTQNS